MPGVFLMQLNKYINVTNTNIWDGMPNALLCLAYGPYHASKWWLIVTECKHISCIDGIDTLTIKSR